MRHVARVGVALAALLPCVGALAATGEAAAAKGLFDDPPPTLSPAQPQAGRVFLLRFYANVCEGYRPTGLDDRTVVVDGDRLIVYVPVEPVLCGVPPPGWGEYPLRMPPLAEGHYIALVVAEGGDPDDPAFTLEFDVIAGLVVSAPTQVPGPDATWLLALAAAIGLLALRTPRD